MSEFDYDELDFDYVDPVEALESAEDSSTVQVGKPYKEQSVVGVFFDEDGEARTEPGPGASPELWDRYFAQLNQESEEMAGQVDPGDYPPLENLSPEATQLVGDAQWEAGKAVAQEQYQQELYERMAQLGRREFEVSSPEAIARVAQHVDAVKADVFTRALAAGYDELQAGRTADDAEEAAGRPFLEREKYLNLTAGTRLASWREGQQQQALDPAREGKPPLPSVFDAPSMQRMLAASDRYVQRNERRQEAEREAIARAQGQWWR